MKKKISISIEEEAIKRIEKLVNEGVFRNKSHVLEFAFNKFVGDKNEN